MHLRPFPQLSHLPLLLACCLFAACDDEGATSDPSTSDATSDATGDSDTATSDANVFTHVPPTDCAFGVIEDWVCAPDRVKTQDWVCPEGWTPSAALGQDDEHFEDFSICSPPATPPGVACPAVDPWHDEQTIRERAPNFAGRIWYAKPDAPAGGDGSRDLPFSTIAAAVAAAADNDIIALSAGTFDEAVTISRPLALVGACVAQTKIAPAPAPDRFKLILIENVSGGVLLSDLTASGEAHPVSEASISGVFIVTPAKPLTTPHVLQSVHIDQAHRTGLLLSQTHATLRDVWITNTQPDFERQDGGYGLNMSADAQADAERVVIRNSTSNGVLIWNDGTSLTLRDAQISDTRPSPTDASRAGQGINSSSAASLSLTRVALLNNRAAGLLADGSEDPQNPVTLSLTDVLISDTQPRDSDQTRGTGLSMTQGVAATASRLTLHKNRASGLSMRGPASDPANPSAPTTLSASDLLILDTQPRASDSDAGTGIEVGFGAQVTIDRAVFSNNHAQGVIVGLESSALTLRDAVIKDTQPSLAFKDIGTGLAVAEQGQATLERVLLSQNHNAGISVDLGSISLTDVAILDTQPQAVDSNYGMGLLITSSQATATRLHIARNHFFGVMVSQLSAPSSATFDTLHIADTFKAPCNNGVCTEDEPGGGGFGIGFGARAELSNFEITGSAFVGLQIYDSPDDPNPDDGPTTLTARDGLITRNLIGINNQTKTFDIATDLQNVLLFGNDVDQDFSELAIPKLDGVLAP